MCSKASQSNLKMRQLRLGVSKHRTASTDNRYVELGSLTFRGCQPPREKAEIDKRKPQTKEFIPEDTTFVKLTMTTVCGCTNSAHSKNNQHVTIAHPILRLSCCFLWTRYGHVYTIGRIALTSRLWIYDDLRSRRMQRHLRGLCHSGHG